MTVIKLSTGKSLDLSTAEVDELRKIIGNIEMPKEIAVQGYLDELATGIKLHSKRLSNTTTGNGFYDEAEKNFRPVTDDLHRKSLEIIRAIKE